MNNIIRSTAGALIVGMAAAACTTSKPADPTIATSALSNAEQEVNRAASDPHVAQYAPTELQRAQGSLKQAQATWHDKKDVAATSHLAYLAHQQATTAVERSSERAADDSVKVAAAERDHLVASIPKSDLQLQQELAGLPAKTDERGVIVTLPKQGFASGQAQLPAGTMSSIDKLASVLKNHPERKVIVEGNTDSEGSKTLNQNLGKERAEAVRTALIKRGVAANRIVMRSYGEDEPVASNDTTTGRKENRRADVVIFDPRGHTTEHATSSGRSSTGQ